MSWQDMKLYWVWRGDPLEKEVNGKKVKYLPPEPSVKKLDYVKINKGCDTEHSLCIGVWDDEIYTPLNRDELEFYSRQYTFDPTIKGAILVKPQIV